MSSSGDQREDDAAETGAALGQLWRDAVAQLLAALKNAVQDALNPLIGPRNALRALRRQVTLILRTAGRHSSPIITQQVTAAVLRTELTVTTEIPATRLRAVSAPVVQQLTTTLERQLTLVQVQAERSIEDAYQRAVADVMNPRPGISQAQRLVNAQRVLDDLADQGITGFTDRAGRNWDLTSYVEMATRTAVSRSLLNIQLNAFTGLGHDAVMIVSRTLDSPCPRCRPWIGKLLSITGATVGHDLTVTPVDGEVRTERVAGTLPEAMAAGLFHPNCRDAAVAYIDGAALTPPGLEPLPPEVYAAEQRQRALERRVRAHRRRVQVALPGTQASAKRHLAAAVRASREHAATHDVKRRSRRERIGVSR